MLSAVIFDVDGLMVDSTPLQLEANRIFLERHGKFHYAGMSGREGMRIIDIVEEFKDIYELPEPIEELYMERQEIFFGLVRTQLELFPGVYELLEKIHRKNIKTAIASSGDKNYITILLNKFPKLKDHFSVVVTSEDVLRGKPFPDVYKKTAEKLEVNPRDCVVLEDSVNGITAAKSAGMQVICVPNHNYPEADYSQADQVFPTLKDVLQAIP